MEISRVLGLKRNGVTSNPGTAVYRSALRGENHTPICLFLFTGGKAFYTPIIIIISYLSLSLSNGVDTRSLQKSLSLYCFIFFYQISYCLSLFFGVIKAALLVWFSFGFGSGVLEEGRFVYMEAAKYGRDRTGFDCCARVQETSTRMQYAERE